MCFVGSESHLVEMLVEISSLTCKLLIPKFVYPLHLYSELVGELNEWPLSSTQYVDFICNCKHNIEKECRVDIALKAKELIHYEDKWFIWFIGLFGTIFSCQYTNHAIWS